MKKDIAGLTGIRNLIHTNYNTQVTNPPSFLIFKKKISIFVLFQADSIKPIGEKKGIFVGPIYNM